MTFVEIDDTSIELPVYNVKLAETLRDAGKENDIAEKAKLMHECMCHVLGADFVRDKTGSDSYEECDLCELANLYNVVNDAYSSAMTRSRNAADESQARDAMASFANMLKGAHEQ